MNRIHMIIIAVTASVGILTISAQAAPQVATGCIVNEFINVNNFRTGRVKIEFVMRVTLPPGTETFTKGLTFDGDVFRFGDRDLSSLVELSPEQIFKAGAMIGVIRKAASENRTVSVTFDDATNLVYSFGFPYNSSC